MREGKENYLLSFSSLFFSARPSREMSGALKVINDSLMKSMDGHSLLNANTIVRREWFQVSSSPSADGLDVEDYLDCFEEFSSHLLRYMVNLTDANVSAERMEDIIIGIVTICNCF